MLVRVPPRPAARRPRTQMCKCATYGEYDTTIYIEFERFSGLLYPIRYVYRPISFKLIHLQLYIEDEYL